MEFFGGTAVTQAANAWAQWMLAMSWQVALLAGIVWLATRLLHRKSAALRYALWLLVLAKLLIPPQLASPWSLGNLAYFAPRVTFSFTADAPQVMAASAVERPPDSSPAMGNLAPSTEAAAITPALPGMPPETAGVANFVSSSDAPTPITQDASSETISPPAPSIQSWGWPRGLMMIWLLAAAGMFFFIVFRAAAYHRKVSRHLSPLDPALQQIVDEQTQRLRLRRPFEVRVSPHLSLPVVCMLRRPTVLLPADLLDKISAAQFAHLIGHELAHIKRRDLEVGWLAAVLLCLYWFHPAVWLAAQNLRREQEMACDDEVLYAARPEGKEYAATILRVAESFDGSMPVGSGFLGLFEVGEHLLQRIRSIADGKRPRRAGVKSILTVVAAAVLLAPMGVWERVTAQEDAVEQEITQHYALADDEVKEFIRTTAKNFAPKGLWLPQDAFAQLSAEERSAKVETVQMALGGPNALQEYQAIAEAGVLQDPSLVPGLVKVAWHMQEGGQDNRSKWMAVQALGRIGDKSAVPVLIPLVDHYNLNTRLWARASLVRLTGQNLGSDKAAWAKWANAAGPETAIAPATLEWASRQSEEQMKQAKVPVAASIATPATPAVTTGVHGARPSGMFLRFDGKDDYIVISPAQPLNLTETMTISAWIRVQPGCGDEAAVLRRGDARPGLDPYMFGVYRSRMHLASFRGLSPNHDLAALVTADYDDAWHYWTGVRNAETKRMYLYKDAVLVDEASDGGPIQYATDSMGNEIGAIDHGTWGNWGFFKGEVDQISVWNVARTPEQIAQEMREGLTGAEKGLAALWKFDEDGQTIVDSSPSGITATLGAQPDADAADPARVDAAETTSKSPAQAATATPVPATSDAAIRAWVAAAPAEVSAVVDQLPGDLVFKGQYTHRSRGSELPQKSTVWVKVEKGGKENGDGVKGTIISDFPAMQSAYIARYEIPNFTSYITRSERGGTPAVTHMELGNGWVTVRHYGGEKDGQTESYQVPNGAVFDPNSRPDPYAAVFILVQLGIRNGTGPETTTVYDWDNTGKGMASYDIQMENVGKETITVPAGTFEAQHYVQKQLTFGDTWYKKRPGHITDFWVDDGIILRVLRHREPYEVVLASVEVGQHWLNPTAAPPTAPDASAAPPAQSTQPAVPVTDEATSAEIEAHYAKADAEVQEYIRWTARTFGRSGLWYPAGAFEQLSAEEREQKVQHMVESLNGEYGRHLCGALAEAGAIKDARLVPGLMKQASYHREDSDYDCRPKWMAVSALGRQDDISAVPTLVPLVDHGNTNTRMWARASLARLTDQWFSDDKQAWGKWWNDSGHGPQINLDELKPWAPPGQAAASSAAPEAGAAAVPAAAATPQTTVTGRVTDTQEKPIANARVVIRGGDHAPMLYEKAETGEDGRYSVTAKPGDWRLSVYADGFATLSRSHTVSEGVNPGWDFVLPVSAHVSGRVTDSEGKPAAIRVLELWPIETGPPPVPGLSFEPTGGEKPPVTQSDGRFELPDVAPGKYSIVVYGESPFGGDRSVQQVPIRGRLLDVQSSQRIEDLEIVVNPPEQFALSGHVRTAQGGPIRGIVVDTFIPHGRHWWTKTDENGAYRLEGLDGMGQSTFDMFFNDVPSGGSYKVVGRAVPLNSANVDLIVPENGGISGTVRNAKTGEAVSGYEVKVPLVHLTDCGVDWEEPQVQIERQADNTFSIANVPAGEAVIEVRAGGLGVQHFTAAVKAGETLPLACDMLGPAVLEGMTTVDGQPKSAGVIVDGEWLNSDDAGKFHFEQFPNGEHIIGFFVDNGRHRTAEVTLKSGETTRVDVELGGSSIIRGTVQFSEDEPFCMCTVRLAAKPSPDGWYESGHPEPKEYVLAYSKMRKSGETYELRGIPAGTWYLMAGVHRAEMWRSILAHSQTIEVKENETLTIDLDLTQAN